MFNQSFIQKLLLVCLATILVIGCGTSHKSSSKHPSHSAASPILKKYRNILQASVTNEKLYTFIDEWMGVPHKLGGNDKKGIDCSHFVHQCQKQVYVVKPFADALHLSKQIKQVPVHALKEGHLVFFSFNAKQIDHVGIYLINHYFVHASTSKGIMISSMEEPIFKKTYRTGGAWI